jgi:hypothetical protein
MIKWILYKVLDVIDFFENCFSKEPEEWDKIKQIFQTNFKVETDTGFKDSIELNVTKPFKKWTIKTEMGKELSGAGGHIVVREDYIYDTISNLKKGDKIITKDGTETITSIKKSFIKSNMIDLTVDSNDNLYYTNDILSHNTISTSIFILWYVLFNDDKGVMIVANKSNTTIEIMDKIKSIYKLLPFFLKRGAVNWSQKKVAFENGCRVQSEAKSKEPAIGFTVDLLYFDEFAHIPSTVIEPYYRAAVPTISSIKDSKIIITSTPNGYNLFHDIWQESIKDEDDPDRGPFKPMKVLWWQVKGRRDIWIYPMQKVLDKYKIKEKEIKDWLKSMEYEIRMEREDTKNYIKVKFDLEDEEKTSIEHIRTLRFRKLPITELCMITNWKEEQTKIIKGEENFKQEFDVKFITGDKSLFNDVDMERLNRNSREFKNFRIPILDKKLKLNYEGLKFIDDPRIFDLKRAKDYFIVAGIDFSEGLGIDSTVMTLYKIRLKNKKLIQKNRHKYKNFYEYFQIEQIGTFKSSHYSVKEFSELFYLLFFEIFDPEKCKVTFEYNQFGGEFLAHLPQVQNSMNDYAQFIFARFKHSKDAKNSKIGMKVNTNKNLLVRDYQSAIKNYSVIVHDSRVVKEMEIFTRQETNAGNYTYRAESGHDDCVMSVIHTCQLLENIGYKDLVEIYMNEYLPKNEIDFINNIVSQSDETISESYNNIIGSRKKVYKMKENINNQRIQNQMMNKLGPKNISSPFGR